MDPKQTEQFNTELKALLIKYNVSLQVAQNIQIVPNQVEKPKTIKKKK